MFKTAVITLSVVFTLAPCRAQETMGAIPGNTATCLGRIYTEVVIPAGWGTDGEAGTRFIQSNAGTLGLTIEYELGIHANADTYPYSGFEAMFGIGEVSINKWINDENIVRLEDRRWGQDLRSKIENSSQVWHHDYHQGQGVLLQLFRDPFVQTQGGPPNTPECDGLIYSFEVAQNIIEYSGFGTSDGHSVPYGVDLGRKAAQSSIYYKSNTTSRPSVNDNEKPFLYQNATWQFPFGNNPNAQQYFWTLTNIQPRTPFTSFY